MTTTYQHRPTTPETNKLIACHFLELISAGQWNRLGALIAPEWTMIGGPPDLPHGQAGLAALAAAIGPVKQTWRVEQIIAEGDLVAVRAVNRCVMDSFFGVSGRGIEQVFAATFIFRIVDNRVAFTWRTADDLGRLIQLGARIEDGAA